MGNARRTTAAVLGIALLLAACFATPILLAHHVHPAVGIVATVSATILWARLVRRTPGFAQGIISLAGLGLILSSALVCLIHWLKMAG